MKTLNFNSRVFAVGRTVTAIKEYKQGTVQICVGDKGKVEDITIESFPDLFLFDIKIIHMRFGTGPVGMAEEIANEYFVV